LLIDQKTWTIYTQPFRSLGLVRLCALVFYYSSSNLFIGCIDMNGDGRAHLSQTYS